MRCKLIGFHADAADALDVSSERIGAISSRNLATEGEEIATYPLSRPRKEAILPFEGINPAWQAQFAALKALVLDVDFAGKKGITEAEWQQTLARFDAFKAWNAAKKGECVEPLGLERICAVLKDDRRQALLDLVAADKALEAEANAIDEVDKLTHLYRDFYSLLRNYVTFVDFYGRLQGTRGMFEVGQLYIDQRCCDLCVRVADMGQHGDMPKLSGMFLLYCTCTSKVLGQKMDIVAVMTNGRTRDLRPGKNGVFYDLQGRDWDAVITKVVENPISIPEAFWSPYRKFWDFCVGLVNKSAADKDAKMTADLQASATATSAAPADAAKKQPFDIAKFAGIFAAIGLALGYLGSFLTKLAAGIASTPLWEILLVILAIMLLISGPSCFIAWGKLRRRNLGPVLNANGWAINSSVLVNIPFGNVLTSVAKYPRMNLDDPFKPRTPLWRKILWWIIGLLVLAGAVLYFSGLWPF